MPRVLHPALGAALFTLCLAPAPARAFCGFFVSGADSKLYNNASQVALLRDGNRTVMSMSNNYQGPPEDFAMVVPVPVILKKEDVKTLLPGVFDHVDQLSAPRLVEYWEQDPCMVRRPMAVSAKGGMAPRRAMMKKDGAEEKELGVKIEAQFTVGEYEVLILSAKDSGGLETWLRGRKYKIPDGAAGALSPYIRDQMKFFVAKVDIKKVRKDDHGMVVLSPLQFSYDSAELRLPVRLGLLNAKGAQDLIIYLLHPEKRIEVANYKNVFVPTNIEVADAVRGGFGSFYAELFDATLQRAGGKAVVTEYAWQTTSCDPCPTPPLSVSDLVTLGAKLPGGDAPPQPSGPLGMPRRRPGPPGMFFGSAPAWVLTRLHTRYDKSTLSDDLLFREAKPVLGGRANWDGTVGDQGAVEQDGGVNNFQGRYIIRHYWEGRIACQSPQYGTWGGPPDGGSSALQAAKDLANAPRGQLNLSAVVRSPVPSLGLKGRTRPLRPGEKRQ